MKLYICTNNWCNGWGIQIFKDRETATVHKDRDHYECDLCYFNTEEDDVWENHAQSDRKEGLRKEKRGSPTANNWLVKRKEK